jgi:hypothetical protein
MIIYELDWEVHTVLFAPKIICSLSVFVIPNVAAQEIVLQPLFIYSAVGEHRFPKT